MKKVWILFVMVLLSVTFIGCTDTTTISSTTLPLEEMNFTKETVNFVNFSTEFIKDEPINEVGLYYFEDKSSIPYVDITEFITLLLGIIDESIQIEVNGKEVKVFVEYVLTEEEKAEYGITEDSIYEYVIFDFESTSVSAPSIDSFDYFTGETETDFSAGLTLVSSYEETLPTFQADLTPYGFTFKAFYDGETNRYTIPLSLAGLFLTGSMFDVVLNGETLYGVDTYQLGEVNDTTSPLYDVINQNVDMDDQIWDESENFLRFAFDYFYGLKAYKGIDSFIPRINFSKQQSFSLSLYDFADSLNDMHTGVITAGHNDPDYDYYGTEGYSTFIYDYVYNYYGASCDLTSYQIYDLTFYEDMAFFEINEFTIDFKEEIAPYMEQIREANPKYVVIDMSCNGGGVLAGVFHLLNYLTDEDISFYTTSLGANSSATYDVEGDKKIDAEFYILTSSVTYSAANLFTALATEMDLARTFGSKSGGGACSVKALVLPNGAIMQMSSNMNLTYSTFETVEEGVETEYFIDFYNRGKLGKLPLRESYYYDIVVQMSNETE